jgi:hypothetical protein
VHMLRDRDEGGAGGQSARLAHGGCHCVTSDLPPLLSLDSDAVRSLRAAPGTVAYRETLRPVFDLICEPAAALRASLLASITL